MGGFPLPNHQYFTTKMNVSAHEDKIATLGFPARTIYIPKEKEWFLYIGMPMRLMRLGGMGGIPKPLVFLRNINGSGEKLKCRDFIFVRGNIYFCCKILMIWKRKSTHFLIFVIFARNVTYYALKRLSDLMSGRRFRKPSPKYQFWHCKNQ